MRHSIALLLLAGLLVGCQQAPQQEVDAVRQALAAAESAEAEKYASEALEEARQAVRGIDEELAAQADKFAPFRSYERANELIAEAQTGAAAAREAAVEGKEAARNEAETAQAQAEAALTEAREMIASLESCARKPKGFKADLEALQGRLDGLATEAASIGEALGREDFSAASAQAGSVGGQVQTLLADMTTAKEKIRC